MTAIDWASNANRFQDRTAFAQRMAAMRPGEETAEQALARLNAEDLDTLKGVETTASYARGEGVVIAIGDVPLNMRDPLTHYDQIYSGRAPRMPDGSAGSMTALNVDFVVDAQTKIADGNVDNIAYYAEYVQKSLEAYQRVTPGYGFTGYAGTDRVTHDVNQYIDWMYERAGIDRPKSLGEISGAFTPAGARPANLSEYLDVVEMAARRGAAAASVNQQHDARSSPDKTSVASVGDVSTLETLAALRAEVMQLMSIDKSDLDSAVSTLKKIGKIIEGIAGMGGFAVDNHAFFNKPSLGQSVLA